MKIWIYCGVSGSGKSTLIRERHPTVGRNHICSADHHFENLYNIGDPVYTFKPEELGKAHGACLRKFVRLVQERSALGDLVVDNTNSSVAELAPYVALGQAYGHEVQIITLRCAPGVAFQRNQHEVPLETIIKMAKNLEARDIPPWWNHEIVEVG